MSGEDRAASSRRKRATMRYPYYTFSVSAAAEAVSALLLVTAIVLAFLA